MNDFDDIRPYNDSEVPAALARLVADPELMDVLLSRQFPLLTKVVPDLFNFLARPFLSRSLLKLTRDVFTVSDFQEHMTKRLREVLDRTTDNYQFSGLDNLDSDRAYLFMSNHRDIALDPALVNLGLSIAKRNTVRIAIGDNLLSKPFASDLMRVNRSFIVKRSVTGRRDKLEALKHLSCYIRYSLRTEEISIWIAQAEGRAKNGCDRTETALLKMLALSKESDQSFAQATGELNIIPVAISYEYDPCDADKACELYAQQEGISYTKDPFEDLDSIQKGFVDYKGRIQITFGEPVTDKYENADLLAAEIDRQIHLYYQLFPTNIIAWKMHCSTVDKKTLDKLKSQWPDEDWTLAEDRFNSRINAMPLHHQAIAIAAYAAPVNSQLQYSMTGQES
ncbi:1-acyl-sn-glycerol-3-phosphate acyltransferase [Porticoccaceae bacterium]|nr:1-acyl-sn-glycerol-3-phosphate acyltransferase [Porticoccaceae bacterium]